MRASVSAPGFLVIAALAACGSSKAAPDAPPPTADARLVGFDRPELVCPGGPGCATTGNGVLEVGAGKHTYTPVIAETWTDTNNNGDYDVGEPYVDANSNGKFDAFWLFGGGKAANGVKTDLEARALAFREGDVSVAIVYLDTTGFLAGDMDAIRADPALAGFAIDHVIIGSTHAHLAVDTVGLWGPDTFTTGYDPAYVATVRAAAVSAIRDAMTSLAPAHLQIAKTLLINDPANPASKTDRWAKDLRDPIIFDPTMTVARFVRADDESKTIGTLVNWADHPEVALFGEGPPLVSAHYPHWLRQYTEAGFAAGDFDGPVALTRDLPGWGGITVFVQGALGGQIGSLRGTAPLDRHGVPVTMESHEMDEALGANAARRALEIIADSAETVSDLPLGFRTATYAARVDNIGFQLAFQIGLLAPHPLVGYDSTQPIASDNPPWVPLRSTYLQIGPIGLVTAPGELHPELWVGGYTGGWSWGWTMLDATKPNTPDLATAPAGPYLRDLVLANPGVEYPILAGLAEDYTGYLVPHYNYVLDPDSPYLSEAPGDHYEETYSLGPDCEEHVVQPILALVAWRP
ncbi:MAG: hypothetical protein K8W52_36225 [Deltaproteobacteria bacterium]|nr:hypothetical protein [Deltaproteobacteria bacterium]